MSSPRKKTRSCQCLLSSAPNALRFNLHSHYRTMNGTDPGNSGTNTALYEVLSIYF
jgi:hypothetical protein